MRTRLTLTLPPPVAVKVRRLAQARRQSVSALVSEWVDAAPAPEVESPRRTLPEHEVRAAAVLARNPEFAEFVGLLRHAGPSESAETDFYRCLDKENARLNLPPS